MQGRLRDHTSKEIVMADIVKKQQPSNQQQLTEWDPFRAMREMLRWDPFREMAPVFPEFAALDRAGFNPSFDVTETKDAYEFRADVPGVKQNEIEISSTGNRLQITGKRETQQESKTETVYSYERQYGSFTRSFTLPDGADIDHAKSELKDGVLTLIVPKKPGAQAKKIAISAGASKS
jgi:HSP20 family protein